MRYEDASQGSIQDQGPIARDDADQLPAGERGPASGNVITGAGTESGTAGADAAAGATITALSGAGGSDNSFAGGQLRVEGEHGTLSLNARGDYNYVANANVPENSRDTFTYTLANSAGAADQASLTIEIGKTQAVVDANARRVVPGPDGVVVLPAGVQLSDVRIVGRDLLVMLPDGTQMLIVDGAVFVPQLVINDIEVPSSNLAALLIEQEPRPASGVPQSSGGNFIEAVGPLDPGTPLGDLLPPTQLDYTPPDFRDVGLLEEDREPSILIQTPDQPAGVQNATAVTLEAALPARGNEPQGSGEEAAAGANGDTREAVSGTILIDSLDTPNTVVLDGFGAPVTITTVGQTVQGQYGTLVITSITPGAIGYTYTLADNNSGNTTSDVFTATVTDRDGDAATATLTINIVDDTPTARADSDSIAAGQFGPATGNVVTDAAAGDAGDADTNAADTVGADNATVTAVTGFNNVGDTTFDGNGNLQVNGQYGVLLIKANGDYSYTRNANTPGGVNDVFNYTLTDGDGDSSTATLTIAIGDLPVTVGANAAVQLDDETLAGGIAGGVGDVDPNTANTSGTLSASGGDGARTFALSASGAPSGFTFVASGSNLLIQQNNVTVITVTLNTTTGAYTVVQNAPIAHPAGANENDASFTIGYSVTDIDGDSASGSLTINADDDSPVVSAELNRPGGLTLDESAPVADSVISFGASTLVKGEDPHLEGGIAIGSGVGTAPIVAVSALLGADGPAAGTQPLYTLSVTNAVSGLVTTKGTAINLVRLDNGVVVGQVQGTTTVAFAVSINESTGVVTVEQYLSLRHP